MKQLFKSIAFAMMIILKITHGHASTSGDLLHVLSTDIGIIKQLDQFNQHMATSYVDCICAAMESKGLKDSRCQNRKKNSSFVETKINFEGQTIQQTHACAQIIDKLTKRIKTASHSMRTSLSLIQAHKRVEKFTLQLERPENAERLKNHIVSKDLSHLEFVASEASKLDPLTDEEAKDVIKKHFAKAESIRNKFLSSSDYQLLFSSLNEEEVLDYLKTGNEGNLDNEIARLRSNGSSPFLSLKGFTEIFRKFMNSERIDFIELQQKQYKQELDNLPMILFVKNSTPSMTEILTALLRVEDNAKKRTRDSIEALEKFHQESSDEQAAIAQYAFLMDHELSRKYLPLVLKSQGWREEDVEQSISKLAELRQKQIKRKQVGEFVVMAGAVAVCYLPYPGIKTLSVGARLIIRNFCLLGSSGGVNTYMLLESRSLYHEKLEKFLSTPDGWNKMVKANEVLEKKNDYSTMLLLIGFEYLPAIDILKLVSKM